MNVDITEKSRMTIGLVLIIVGGLSSFFFAMTNLASKDYVDMQVSEVKQYLEKDSENIKKDNDYIKKRVDDIYSVILSMRRK